MDTIEPQARESTSEDKIPDISLKGAKALWRKWQKSEHRKRDLEERLELYELRAWREKILGDQLAAEAKERAESAPVSEHEKDLERVLNMAQDLLEEPWLIPGENIDMGIPLPPKGTVRIHHKGTYQTFDGHWKSMAAEFEWFKTWFMGQMPEFCTDEMNGLEARKVIDAKWNAEQAAKQEARDARSAAYDAKMEARIKAHHEAQKARFK